MKIVLFIALLVCFAASEAGKRVVGGSPATATQASFTVSLVYDSGLSPPKEGYFCSGSIIGSNYVLTAASCLRDIYTTGGRNYDVNRNRVVVIVNHPNLTQNAPNSKQFDVDTIYYNTYSFISGPVADVAIIRTNDNMLQGGTGATRVYLADSNTASYGLEDPGYSATVSGWGIKTPDTSTGEYADYLTSSDVTLIDTTTCQSASPGFAISNNYICAGGIYRGSCIGDEGAPLVVDVTVGGTTYYLQVGIAALQSSITQPRCDGSYGVYSRVSQFKGWAENFAGNLPDIPTPTTTGVNSGIATTGLTGTTLQSGNTTSSPNNAQMITISAFLVVFMAFFI